MIGPTCGLCGRPAMMLASRAGAHFAACAKCGGDYTLVARPNDTGRLAKAVCREAAARLNAPEESTVEDLLRIIATAEVAREETPEYPMAEKAQREMEEWREALK